MTDQNTQAGAPATGDLFAGKSSRKKNPTTGIGASQRRLVDKWVDTHEVDIRACTTFPQRTKLVEAALGFPVSVHYVTGSVQDFYPDIKRTTPTRKAPKEVASVVTREEFDSLIALQDRVHALENFVRVWESMHTPLR